MIYIISAVIILLVDRKVIRTLPAINRWFTYFFLLGGMAAFSYTLLGKNVVYLSTWISKWLSPLVPF